MISPEALQKRRNSLSVANETLKRLLTHHYQTRGIGPDAYRATPMVHPMAEGRFLSAAAASKRMGLMSSKRLQDLASTSMRRLQKRKRSFGDGIGWGLEFSWKGAKADAPYLITTAVVAHGLLDVVAELPDVEPAKLLLDQALEGLSSWCDQNGVYHSYLGIELPAFSDNMQKPVLNAAAYAAGVLIAAKRDSSGGELARLEAIKAASIPGVGWPYMPEAEVIDLLHQCYILTALDLSQPECSQHAAFRDQRVIETVALFNTVPGKFLDTGRIILGPLTEPPPPNQILRVQGGYNCLLRNAPARLWSLGELLAVTSASIKGRNGEALSKWRLFAMSICEEILFRIDQNETESTYPRHTMHASYGLARYIEAIRQPAIPPKISGDGFSPP